MPQRAFVPSVSDREAEALWRALAGLPVVRFALTAPSGNLHPLRATLLARGWHEVGPTETVDDLHLAVVDTPGAAVPRDELDRSRPWVLVVGTGGDDAPAEPAGYTLVRVTPGARVYVAAEHPDLRGPLGHDDVAHPDGSADARTEDEVERLTAEVVRWRTAALTRWTDAATAGALTDDLRVRSLENELLATRQTLSWRVTAPLRAARRLRDR